MLLVPDTLDILLPTAPATRETLHRCARPNRGQAGGCCLEFPTADTRPCGSCGDRSRDVPTPARSRETGSADRRRGRAWCLLRRRGRGDSVDAASTIRTADPESTRRSTG